MQRAAWGRVGTTTSSLNSQSVLKRRSLLSSRSTSPFGPGARVYSEQAAYVPMGLGGKVVFAKVSLVDADVPLLLSKGLLEGLGMIMDMGKKEIICLLYTSPSPRDRQKSRMPSSA